MSSAWPEHFSADVVREAFGPRLGGYTIALEAWRRGLRVRFFDNHLRKYEISDGIRKVRFDKARPSLTTAEAISIEQDKFLTAEYLRRAGVPVPDSWVLDPSDPDVLGKLVEHAQVAGYPVVLKPLRGSMGRDVYTNITSQEDLLETFKHLEPRLKLGQKLVLEQHFKGEDYRVLVVGDVAVAACLRVPANVTGDGGKSVQQLIDQKNAMRRENPYLGKKPILRDRETDQHLRQVGYSYDSVPGPGEEVRLRSKANASQGGDSVDRTAEVPEAVYQAAVRAVDAIPGLAIAGVDILFNAVARRVEDSFRIIELNSRPEIEINMYPWRGRGQDAPKHIIDVFFPESQRSADPGSRSMVMNLQQILAPIRGASADQVLVKKKPSHNYPLRKMYRHRHEGRFTDKEQGEVHLAARQAGVSGHICAGLTGSNVVVCGTPGGVDKFLRLIPKTTRIDHESAQDWEGLVSQGFYFDQ